MTDTDIVDFCTSFNEHFPEGKGKELKGRWQMSKQDDREKLDCCLSALRIILTWAEFEYDGNPRGHALVPDHVSELIRKTLKEIGEKQ